MGLIARMIEMLVLRDVKGQVLIDGKTNFKALPLDPLTCPIPKLQVTQKHKFCL